MTANSERASDAPASPQRRIYIGCSGWAYPSWKPGFYPPRTPAKKLLSYYASQLNSVEVNYTFRQLPKPDQLAAWIAETPPDFRFSFKAPQRITHLAKLRNCAEALAALRAALSPAIEASRMGIVLFQLPPQFRADAERLRAFLADASRTGLAAAFEFRHPSWFVEGIFSVLEQHGAALCIAESDELETPPRRTAPFACYRLRRSHYTAEDLRKLGDTFLHDAERGDVYAYFKHEEAPDGPLRARTLLEAVRR